MWTSEGAGVSCWKTKRDLAALENPERLPVRGDFKSGHLLEEHCCFSFENESKLRGILCPKEKP